MKNRNGHEILASVVLEAPTNMSSTLLHMLRNHDLDYNQVYLEKITTIDGNDLPYVHPPREISEDDILKLQYKILNKAKKLAADVVHAHQVAVEWYDHILEVEEHLSDQIID